ncbi:cytochrome P450 [Apiospora saccharicola]|uniref:Cytochrome P450 n=1 Tax=Apiospora saccharicola TaxID=335842 RepID=A0ABR1UMF0_9PEZI
MLQSPFLLFSAFLCVLVWLYRRAYPRPYPGIPYNAKSAGRILGDIPDLLEAVKTANDPAKFVFRQCRKLGSPVIQLFLKPFHAPIIFIDDVREVKDLIGLRTKEFDRAPSTSAVFAPLSPHSSIVKPTNAQWRDQRRYWEGLMGKSFLHRVVAPKMYESAQHVVALFQAKAAIADGRPFDVMDDFDVAAFDIIWHSIMGSKLDGLKSQHSRLCEVTASAVAAQPASKDAPAKTLKSFSQPWHHWFLRQLPEYKRYWALKNRLLDSHIEETRRLYAGLSDDEAAERADTCALDLGIRRERLEFKDKFGKVAVPTTAELHDELFLFLIAGHDTTAVTLSWALKFLTNHPEAQTKLRQSLREAFPNNPAAGGVEGSLPSVEEILAKTVPYMEACLEEMVRLGNIHPRLVRIAVRDTEVLGCPIPKGAQVLSSSYVGERLLEEVPEARRSRRSQQCRNNFLAHWDPRGMDDFVPERWLDGDKYEPKSFPRMAFSAGPRVCYGQKFALQELRITLTLLILSFKLEPIPDVLNSMAGFQRVLRVPKQSFVRLAVL